MLKQSTQCKVHAVSLLLLGHSPYPSHPLDYAITHNLTPFISMQNHYSLLYREEEREMFPTLKVCPIELLAALANLPPDIRRRLYPVVPPRAWPSHASLGRADNAQPNRQVSSASQTLLPLPRGAIRC